MLHRFNRKWRAKSARRIVEFAKERNSDRVLEVFARHANGKAQYAVWKEQVRALAIYTEKKLHAMVNYIHANPVRRKLVKHPGEWEHSSWRFYGHGEKAVLEIEPPVL